LELTGASTYTGATTVSAGTLALTGSSMASNITVASGASLEFTIDSPASSTGTLDLTNGTVIISGTPSLASHTLMTTSGISGTPVLQSPISGYALVVDGTTLKLESTGGNSWTSWKTANSVTGGPNDDQDGDGVSNALEFLLGGSSATNDIGLLPTLDASGPNFIFTFERKAGILDGISALSIEVSTDLTTWDAFPSPYTVGADTATSSTGVTVTEDTPAGFDTITLTIPKGTDTKKFARINLLVNDL
jgi:autotransporter-associated beta strand protein